MRPFVLAFVALGSLAGLASPALAIDPCLVGTWEAREVSQFAGFRVTFKVDGTQIVDYSRAQPLKLGNNETITWAGVGTNVITTEKNVARIKERREGHVTMTLTTPAAPTPVVWKLGTSMGLAGLGNTTGDNAYVCTAGSLTYQGSTHQDRRPNYHVKLTRLDDHTTREKPSTDAKDPCQVSDRDRKLAEDYRAAAKRLREDAAKARQHARAETDPRRAQQWEEVAKSSDGSARLRETEAARLLCEPPPAAVASAPTPAKTTPIPPPPASVSPPSTPAAVCGPDVTLQLKKLLTTVADDYEQLPFYKRAGQCAGLAFWDIDVLRQHPEYLTPAGCALPSHGACAQTVAVEGRCYRAGIVNYAIYGVICRKCSARVAGEMLHLVYAFGKWVSQLWGPGTTWAITRQESAWITTGWLYAEHGALLELPASDALGCQTCSAPAKPVRWRYTWMPEFPSQPSR